MPDGRVNIALTATALAASPTWTRIDDDTGIRVASMDIRQGRQTEFDQTETSTATVVIHDRDGAFNPYDSGSAFYNGGDFLDGKQISLGVRNPVTSTWESQFRGHIDEINYDFHKGEEYATVTIQCVGLFDYLAGAEIIPGYFGDSTNSDGAIVYQEEPIQSRLEHYLTDAGVPSALFIVFTGNVDIMETKYDPGDSILMAMRDAADAEFPTIANLYEDRFGRVVFHGRHARFDPVTVAATGDWDFTTWNVGDGTAIGVDPTLAQLRPPLTWSRPRRLIRNAAIAYPRGMAESLMSSQVVVDSASITDYGYRSWSARDLLTLDGNTTGLDGPAETKLFSSYIVANYAVPMVRVENLTLKSIRPDDPRGTATWAMLTGCDVSDVVNITHDYPASASGMFLDFYIEGRELSVRPLNPSYDMVELSLNVSPAAAYATDVFAT